MTKLWPHLLTATCHHRHSVGPSAAPSGKAGAQVGEKPSCDFCPMLRGRHPLAALLKLVQIYSGGSNPFFCYVSFQLLTFPSLTVPTCNQILHLHIFPIQLKKQTAPYVHNWSFLCSASWLTSGAHQDSARTHTNPVRYFFQAALSKVIAIASAGQAETPAIMAW